MRESKLYIEYFKKNLTFLFVAVVIGGGAGLVLALRQPIIYSVTQVVEMDYDNTNVESRVTLGDELVSTTRAAGLEHQLGVLSTADLVKTGPLSVTVTLSSKDHNQPSTDLTKVLDYITYKYPIHRVGDTVESQHSVSKLIGLLAGTAGGFLLGNLYLLLRSYLKYH